MSGVAPNIRQTPGPNACYGTGRLAQHVVMPRAYLEELNYGLDTLLARMPPGPFDAWRAG